MGGLDAQAIVDAAVNTLYANCDNLGEMGRSDGELRLVLAEVVVVVLGWRLSENPAVLDSVRDELNRRVENKQGRPGHLETLLLRVAYERYQVDHRKLSAWGTACHNLAAHLEGEEELKPDLKSEALRRTWAQRYVSQYGAEKLRKNLIDDGANRSKRLRRFVRGR